MWSATCCTRCNRCKPIYYYWHFFYRDSMCYFVDQIPCFESCTFVEVQKPFEASSYTGDSKRRSSASSRYSLTLCCPDAAPGSAGAGCPTSCSLSSETKYANNNSNNNKPHVCGLRASVLFYISFLCNWPLMRIESTVQLHISMYYLPTLFAFLNAALRCFYRNLG